ncbi:MAG: GAF domain-containing protein [Anaerolineales bacterium]|nr:GAF domain-containing protein [Anaerolineales bacterium]
MTEDQTRALLELLYHVSREVATALDLRTVLQRVLLEAIQNVHGERGSLVVLDDTGKPIDAMIVHGAQFHEHTTQQLRDTVERGLAGWVVRNRKPALLSDTSHDERWLRRPDDEVAQTGAKSAICVPLLARERLVGVLTLVHPVPNAFGPEHLELMQAIADQAGIAVLNARLYTESQRQARVMTALAEGSAAINVSLEFNAVLQSILNQTIQALQVETVGLALVEDTDTGNLVFKAATGHNAGSLLGCRVLIGEGLVGRVAMDGRGRVIPSVQQEKRFNEADRFSGIKAEAIAAAPIRTQGQVIGVLEAINPISGSFDPDALLVMTGLGGLAGTTIQNARLYERLKVAHQHYHELFEDSIDPIIITDWEGKILEANRQVMKLSDFSEEHLQKMKIDQLHEINLEKVGEEFENLKAGGATSYESSLHKRRKGVVPVDVHVRRVEFDETDSLQWILRDITERKELDTLREDLTAMIYHDLRSPLANIVSSHEILGDLIRNSENKNVKSVLNIASHSTARIQRLVNSLLDINQLETGNSVVKQQSADLLKLVKEALVAVEPLATGRRQAVITSLPDELPMVWVDQDMILRVLINLLENAIKYTPVAGEIKIGALLDGAWVQIWVMDNGPGIPQTDQARVFDKFIRLRGAEKPSGMGIGLAFCRLAIQGHDGEIWVESKPEQGTTFYFTLPIATAEQINNVK